MQPIELFLIFVGGLVVTMALLFVGSLFLLVRTLLKTRRTMREHKAHLEDERSHR